jgi:acyl carrier protein
MTAQPQERSGPSETIRCSKCGTPYELGVDAVAVTRGDVWGAGRQTVFLGRLTANRPPMVGKAVPGTPPANAVEIAKTRAVVLEAGKWSCEKCGLGHVNRLDVGTKTGTAPQGQDRSTRVRLLVKSIIAHQLNEDSDMAWPDAELIAELGADELDVSEIGEMLEEEYGGELPFQKAAAIQRVRTVIEYIRSRGA